MCMRAKTGRKETKQKIGSVRLPVAEVVRNGKIRDTWALQDTQKGDVALSLVVRRPLPLVCCLHGWPEAPRLQAAGIACTHMRS